MTTTGADHPLSPVAADHRLSAPAQNIGRRAPS
jgi:hypothetical protein